MYLIYQVYTSFGSYWISYDSPVGIYFTAETKKEEGWEKGEKRNEKGSKEGSTEGREVIFINKRAWRRTHVSGQYMYCHWYISFFFHPSLRLLRTRRGETRKKYISGSSSYVNNWINTVNVEKFVWWKSSHK